MSHNFHMHTSRDALVSGISSELAACGTLGRCLQITMYMYVYIHGQIYIHILIYICIYIYIHMYVCII